MHIQRYEEVINGDNIHHIAGILYILDIIYRPCPICTFNCSSDSKLGGTDTVCYQKLLVVMGVSPIAALCSFGVALGKACDETI